MEDIHENDLALLLEETSLVEPTLKKLEKDVSHLEDYISDKLYNSPMLSDITPITSDFDINVFKKDLKEVHGFLLFFLERVKDFQGHNLDKNWYNYKNYYQFEKITKFLEKEAVLFDNPTTMSDKMDYYQTLLGHLRIIKIKIRYHIWQLNMIIFAMYVKNRNNGTTIEEELIHYFKCDRLRTLFSFDFMGFNVDVGGPLVDNNVNEWGLFLDEYFSRNRKIIDNF